MVHLAPLPGSPRFAGSMISVVDDAVDRASILVEAGFGAVMVENFGDVPFYADHVPPETVAAMTRCVDAVVRTVSVPVGVNVLRNDALAAVAIAASTGASLIRVNVLAGSMLTDQGPIVGRAAEVIRSRDRLAPQLKVWADVFVKHATPPAGLTLEQAALDTWERGGADALVVSGPETGRAPDLERFARIRAVVPSAPLVAGSGADAANLGALMAHADHIVVGTALERDGRPGAALDPERIQGFITAAAEAGLS
jgi:uncharacterized protein